MQRADIVLRPVIGWISKREIRLINWKKFKYKYYYQKMYEDGIIE